MKESATLELAKNVAYEAHAGQFMKDGITPYTKHPEWIAHQLCAAGYSQYTQAVAYLHDVPEDTANNPEPVTARMLLSLDFDYDQIVEPVELLTHYPRLGLDKDQQIRRLAPNLRSRAVKRFDLIHNMDFARLGLVWEDLTIEDQAYSQEAIYAYARRLAYLSTLGFPIV